MDIRSPEGDRPRFLPIAIGVLLVLTLTYTASMPAACSIAPASARRHVRMFYAPIFIAMEHTALRQPLLAWCGLWGCREEVRRYLRSRELDHMGDVESQTL